MINNLAKKQLLIKMMRMQNLISKIKKFNMNYPKFKMNFIN